MWKRNRSEEKPEMEDEMEYERRMEEILINLKNTVRPLRGDEKNEKIIEHIQSWLPDQKFAMCKRLNRDLRDQQNRIEILNKIIARLL